MSRDRLSYTPIPVSELLRELKDLSQIMMSLAFCSVFFMDDTIYREITRLDDRVDLLKGYLIMQASLATRDKEDAEKMLSVYDMAISVDKISEVSKDLAELAYNKLNINLGSHVYSNSSTNFIYSLKINGNSPFRNRRIAELYSITGEYFDVLAIRRRDKYILSPEEETLLLEDDVVYLKGFTDTIKKIIKMNGVEGVAKGIAIEPEKIDDLIYIKNLSEFMLDLAYGALFTKSIQLADEIGSMEEALDQVTKSLKEEEIGWDINPKEKLGIIKYIDSCENIGDAALDMTYSLRMGIEPHPVIEAFLEEADERYMTISIPESASGWELADLGLTRMGVDILAIKREGYWYINPLIKGFPLKGGEELIIQYFEEAEKEVIDRLRSIGINPHQ